MQMPAPLSLSPVFRLATAAFLLLAGFAAASAKSVVINEIHYNPASNTVRAEFIELYNANAAPVDLTGWRISGAVDFSFPAGTTMQPGAYLVVAENPAVLQARFGTASLGPWTGGLSSDGETIRLRDAADAVISRVDYGVGFPWPVAPNGDGATLELLNPEFDEDLGANWRASIVPPASATTDTGSPGAQNLQFIANAPPAIRQVAHAPKTPASSDPIVFTAKVTDPDGVASVSLSHQIVAPGSYIPAFLPNPIVGSNIATETRQPNPAFEDPANWTSIAMHDDGLDGDATAGDDIYLVTLPAQPNRTLVRYRITVTDGLAASVRVPFADDGSLNFACFVYDGVPAYGNIPASNLTTLPVYQVVTRPQDYAQCLAYSGSNQINQGTQARFYFNWECAFVYDGVVYDHTDYRLRGANGRYQQQSKRSMRFRFHKGSYLAARDQDGNLYPRKWARLTTGRGFDNRLTLTYALNEAINYHLWNAIGVPAPNTHWVHYRVVQTPPEQQTPWVGDFQGLVFIQEDYDVRFLESHNLGKGNVYKLLNQTNAPLEQQRYQGPNAPTDGRDHNWVEQALSGSTPPAVVAAGVNLDEWNRYHALVQAIRHYDYWPSANKNMTWYFEPVYTPGNQNRGKLWIMPFDTDASWGPNWNNGQDVVYNSLFSCGDAGGDGGTNPTLWPGYFNAVREIRDLLFQPDQINPLIDEFAAVIAPIEQADSLRWKSAPASAGSYSGIGGAGIVSLANLVQDMKNFAFTGGSWPGGNVGAGGRAAFLDSLQASLGEGAQIPGTPAIAYAGAAGFPNNNLTFTTTAFADPQGAGSFAAVQWRMAEIIDPAAPAYVPGEKLKLEITASYDSGEVTAFSDTFRFPAAAARAGRTCRARVRHKDSTGRWSHWSAPVQFTATAADTSVFKSSVVVSEVMYHPLPATPSEIAQGWTDDDFEYVELRNVSATPVDLTDIRFTKGVNFDFTPGYMLPAGGSALVVRNLAAFEARYGAGRPIAGVWQSGGMLSNGGEELKLSFGPGQAIVDFTYTDSAPWPPEADGAGYSLVLIKPETLPDPAMPANWRASRVIGGSPGGDDRITFASWGAANGGIADPLGDHDLDGWSDVLEFALDGNPEASDPASRPVAGTQSFVVAGVPGNYLTLAFRRQLGAEELAYHPEFAAQLPAWNENGALVQSTHNGDGTVTEVWRSGTPISAGGEGFARVRVVLQ